MTSWCCSVGWVADSVHRQGVHRRAACMHAMPTAAWGLPGMLYLKHHRVPAWAPVRRAHPNSRAPQAACEQRQVSRCRQNQHAPQLSVNADATRWPTARRVRSALTCPHPPRHAVRPLSARCQHAVSMLQPRGRPVPTGAPLGTCFRSARPRQHGLRAVRA